MEYFFPKAHRRHDEWAIKIFKMAGYIMVFYSIFRYSSISQFPLIANLHSFKIFELSDSYSSSRTWFSFKRFLDNVEISVTTFYFSLMEWIIPERCLNNLYSFKQKFLIHFHCEFNGHMVHKLTRWCLNTELTCRVSIYSDCWVVAK